QMPSEAGYFRIEAPLDSINEKLIRRHPHIFGDAEARTADAVKKRRDEIKAEEKAAKNEPVKPLLDSVPRSLPALMEAQQISSKVARVGFDWSDLEQGIEKLQEEVRCVEWRAH